MKFSYRARILIIINDSLKLCGFRENYSTQHCLLAVTEKIKNAIDKGEYAGILLTDLSKRLYLTRLINRKTPCLLWTKY